MERPETRYAWNGDVALAYQVVGEGPTDLLYLQGYFSNVDMNWESPSLGRFLRGLARHGRLVVTDRRGWGCSERFSPGDVPDIDLLTDDLRCVLEAAGSSRAVVIASFECAIVATLFAATYPERASALILIDPMVNYVRTEETPWMPALAEWEELIAEIRAEMGTTAWIASWPEGSERDWWDRYIRASVVPGAFVAELRRYLDTDICPVLSSIQVPTLVLADEDGFFEVRPETSRYVAREIAGARLVEHSSAGGFNRLHYYARRDAILEEIGRFAGGIREEEASFDRVLATVLFTDIVGSTERAAELGDRRWRDLVARHNHRVRALLRRYRGVEVDTAGDGFFATFDGPARAVRCATAIVNAVRPLDLEVRAGLHTGEVETVGEKVSGLAVSIGARVAGLAGPSEVLASQTVKDLVAGSGLVFEDRGARELKNVPGEWRLYAVTTKTE